ncbi:MAG: hypothetical protein K1X64_19840 [Myxococcaceae bacterium]|nr:hypothetical protein [Myxococcaceae bacterium]
MVRTLVGFIGLVVAAPVWAKDYYVATLGSDAPGCGTASAPCQRINFVFTQFQPLPTEADPAVVHVGPGVYRENAAPAAPQTGFAVPNFTQLISDRGADETALEVDLGALALSGIVEVVRGEKFGIPDNAEGIVIDGFTLRGPGGVVKLDNHQLIGINFGAGVSTQVAPRHNVIRNNLIAVQNQMGRTQSLQEGAGVYATGGVTIDCNVFQNIDSVGIALSSVESNSDGTNATQPAVITRNWFRGFTDTAAVDAGMPSDDEFIAVGVRVPATIRGNLLDFQRPQGNDRDFGIACFDCSHLVVENNLLVNFTDLGAPIALVSVGSYGATPFTPRLAFNTVAGAKDGVQHYLLNAASQPNFAPTVTSSILWVPSPLTEADGGTAVFDVQFSNTQAAVDGSGNISADPRFVNVTTGDYQLSDGSPSAMAGEGSAQQGAYGGPSPFGTPTDARRACALRETPLSFPDECLGAADGMACGNAHCDGNTARRPVCAAQACGDTAMLSENCDDGDPCTADFCQEGPGCGHTRTCGEPTEPATEQPGGVVTGRCGCGAANAALGWSALYGLFIFLRRRRRATR